MAPTVYLVSGSSRGIGLGLVTKLAERDNTIVFAGCRSPGTSPLLQSLAVQQPTNLHIIQLTAADKAGNDAAVAHLVVKSLEVTPESMREHYEVNTIGPLVLFQSSFSLLSASTPHPKYIIISSFMGSNSFGTRVPTNQLPYGASKAAVNWVASKLHYDHPPFVVVPIHPGAVATDGAAVAVKQEPFLADYPLISIERSAQGVLKVVDEAERGEEASALRSYDGGSFPW
ncbi:NAD(P)-binding protein [Calocera cornea HHB12733]|uniref:NAD(P)-binding protein n=1 Tax=Calocera cornea HHB12733 TaxID=1353952 RepID=A0A165E955_9BASI|nr:NAD(P)-binding protein [Calocera cornea HHB12733]